VMCVAAQATIVPSLSLEALIDQSEVIVHGRVARSWPAWDSGHKYIWTHHLIEVIDPLRGAVAGSVVVSEPGGELDGQRGGGGCGVSGGLDRDEQLSSRMAAQDGGVGRRWHGVCGAPNRLRNKPQL